MRALLVSLSILFITSTAFAQDEDRSVGWPNSCDLVKYLMYLRARSRQRGLFGDALTELLVGSL